MNTSQPRDPVEDIAAIRSIMERATRILSLSGLAGISVGKEFVGKKPLTTYMLTASGRKAFTEHLDTLEKLIKQIS